MRTKSEYTEQRDNDLFRAYKEVMKSSEVKSIREAVILAMNSPSVKFWVTAEQATRILSRIRKGDKLETMPKIRRSMFFELYNRYLLFENKLVPMSHICEIIIDEEAPMFYLKLDTAIKLIKKKRVKEQCRKIASLV